MRIGCHPGHVRSDTDPHLLPTEATAMTNMLLPGKIWGTKGFLFWTFLSLLLLGAGSKRILELGSGRSTITFAEYARHRRATFVSLETS